MNFLECGDCHACCSGALVGSAYGTQFGLGKKCIFLVKECCTIYSVRPPTCQKYQCAWTQQILPEWMKPNKCGVLVSVETAPDKQYLKVIELVPKVGPEVYEELDKFVLENKTHYVKIPYENKFGLRP